MFVRYVGEISSINEYFIAIFKPAAYNNLDRLESLKKPDLAPLKHLTQKACQGFSHVKKCCVKY